MKSMCSVFAVSILLFLVGILSCMPACPQSKPADGGKKSENSISISISGVEYDDPGFTSLKEIVKSNIRVKQVSPSFAGGVAKLSVQYPGKATELWDELPASVKQPFKIISIDNTRIELQKKNTGSSNTSVTSTKTPSEENCVNCKYFKVCNYDTAVNFEGVTYRGFRTSPSLLYYCQNGQLKRKFRSSDSKWYSQIIYKSNDPVGTSWKDTINTGVCSHTTMAKGIALNVKGKFYDDVMLVYHNYITLIRCDYYVKDQGSIKSDTLDAQFNPQLAASMKGLVDLGMTGVWKHHQPDIKMDLFFRFNGDGTYSYYAGSVSPSNQMPMGVSYWRYNNNMLELYNSVWASVVRIRCDKKNDPATGKPTLVIQNTETENRTFFPEDNKPAWK